VVPTLLLAFPLASLGWLSRPVESFNWVILPDAVLTAGILAGVAIQSSGWRRGVGIVLSALLSLGAQLLWPTIMPILFPVILNLTVAHLFSRTLRPGKLPLITRIARIERGDQLPEPLLHYSRHLTGGWALFFYALALIDLLLGWLAPQRWLLLFANTLTPLLIALFFLAEYGFRRWRFRHLHHRPLWHLLVTLMDRGWALQESDAVDEHGAPGVSRKSGIGSTQAGGR
jgi:hypothetical protein